jgi:tRNA pseudouridine65 synthase
MHVECLHEDEMMFVLNKPSGLLVHRGWDNAETALVDRARELTPGGTAHPIQRLDRGASGPVLFAKGAEAARELAEWARAGYCRKDYLALVRGECPERLDIDHPIHRRVDGPRVGARTLVRCIAIVQTAPRHVSLVCARPLTGRLHQIRRHMKHANHPLIGDGRYGRGDLNRAFRERYGLTRLALHACCWRVERPDSHAVVGGLVPLPEDLCGPLARMGFSLDENRMPRGLQPALADLVRTADASA